MTVPLLDPRKVLSPNVRVQQTTRDLAWLFNDSRFHVCWRSVFRLVDHMVADVEKCHNHLKKNELPLNPLSICHCPPCCVIYWVCVCGVREVSRGSVFTFYFSMFSQEFSLFSVTKGYGRICVTHSLDSYGSLACCRETVQLWQFPGLFRNAFL